MKCVQSKSILQLTREWWLARNVTRVKHAGSWRVMLVGSLQDKNVQSNLSISWWLELATYPSRESLAKTPCFEEKWLFTFLLIPYYKYSYTHECKELPERILRETLKNNKTDSSTILYIWFSKFLYSHPLHCHTFERIFSQILTSPYSYQWEGYLVLGKQFKREPIHLVDAMGLLRDPIN